MSTSSNECIMSRNNGRSRFSRRVAAATAVTLLSCASAPKILAQEYEHASPTALSGSTTTADNNDLHNNASRGRAHQNQRALQTCAIAGMRSQQCGATGSFRPNFCCPGLVCDGKRCVTNGGNSNNAGGPGQRPGQQQQPQQNDDDWPVDISEVTFTEPPTATSWYGSANSNGNTVNAGDIQLVRPGTKYQQTHDGGGISAAVFGSRQTRYWTLLVPPSNITHPDVHQELSLHSNILMERDAFKFTEMPSTMPSAYPTQVPSHSPSVSPTNVPSVSPTASPTNYPTVTMAPTEWLWTSEPIPRDPPSNYYDYSPNSPRGPGRWSAVNARLAPETKHWDHLDEYIDKDLEINQCSASSRGSRRQSPIDVRFSRATGQCFEYHEIRHRPGEFSVADPNVDAQILPSKLRIDYPYIALDPDDVEDMGDKRPYWTQVGEVEGKLKVKDAVKGPSADIPKGWGYQLPVTHADIKIPSEHWLEGKQYVAEYQLYLIQNRKAQRGAPAISVLIDLDPYDRPNPVLQVALDRFQLEWDRDMAECEARRRKERKLDALFTFGDPANTNEDGATATAAAPKDQSTWLDEPAEEEAKFQSYLRRTQEEALAAQGGYTYFNPWDKEIFRSIWFFGYEGSLTEPPCTEFLEWRIIDTPTTVSKKQLFQMKKLLFHHVDGNCRRTSTHYEGSVARPLQPYNGRLVHRCMCRDFIDDKARKKYGSNRCDFKDRDQFGFNKEVFSKEWYDRTHKYEMPDHQKCAVYGDCADWNEVLRERQPNPSPVPQQPWWWSF